MTEWKAGDRAMVHILGVSPQIPRTGERWCLIGEPGEKSDVISLREHRLYPLPPLLTPEAQAVLDAVLKAVRPDLAYLPSDLVEAIRCYRATIDDPIDALIQIARDPSADRADVIRAAKRVTTEGA